MPWAIEQLLRAGQIVGLDPKEMLLEAVVETAKEPKP